jgi:tetratricopeptide (TPR) repeat protein
MSKKRRRTNPWLLAFLLLTIGGLVYLNLVVVPMMDPPFVPTPTPTRDPLSFIAEADALAAEGKYLQAIESYQGAINADPQNITNYLKISRLQIYTDQLVQAQVNAQNAILLNNTTSEAYALSGWAKGFQKEYLAGEADARRAIELDQNSGLAHAVLAYILALRVEAGVQELAPSTSPLRNPALLWRSSPTCSRHTGRAATCSRSPATTKKPSPSSTPHRHQPPHRPGPHGLGRNLINTGELDRSVFEFTKAYSLNPTDPTPNLFISRVYSMLGEWDKGIQYGSLALRDDPQDPNLYANLGTLYYPQGAIQPGAALPRNRCARGHFRGWSGRGGHPPLLRGRRDRALQPLWAGIGAHQPLQRSRHPRRALLQNVADNADGVFNAGEIISICEKTC